MLGKILQCQLGMSGRSIAHRKNKAQQVLLRFHLVQEGTDAALGFGIAPRLIVLQTITMVAEHDSYAIRAQ